MSTGIGALSKAALKKDPEESAYPKTDWGASDLGSGDQIPFLSEGMAGDNKLEADATLEGKAGLRAADLVALDVAGSLNLQGRFNNIGRLICMALGWENPNVAGATYHGSPETVSAKYKHVFEIDDVLHRQTWTLDGDRLPSGSGGGTWDGADQKVRSGCLIVSKAVSDWRFFSVMVNKMTIKFDPKGTSFVFDLIGYNYSRGSYNSAAFTLATDQRNILFPDYVFSINGAEYGVSNMEIVLDNKLVAERDTATGLYIKEPVRNGMREVTFGFDFLRHESEAFFDDYDAGTARYCSMKAVNGAYNFGVYFSAFKFEKADANIPGAAIIRPKYNCKPYIPAADQFASEWSNIALKKNKEMVIMLTDDHSTNYLTEN
jgi:hypothetical protein